MNTEQKQDDKDIIVTDPVILRQLATGLRTSTGQITGITHCVLGADNVFRGEFHQRVTPTQVKSFTFSYGEGQITFRQVPIKP